MTERDLQVLALLLTFYASALAVFGLAYFLTFTLLGTVMKVGEIDISWTLKVAAVAGIALAIFIHVVFKK